MPHRLSLRTAVLAAVAVGAVLVPSTAAFADSTPAPAPSVVPIGGVAAGESPAPARVDLAEPTKRSVPIAPRGGVAAGERPAGTSGDSTTALGGAAAAALLVAGAGTVVLRRRTAAQQDR